MLETVDQVIEALGGPSKVAAVANVVPSAVSNWQARRRIPSSRYFAITDALTREGKVASPSLFGFAGGASA